MNKTNLDFIQRLSIQDKKNLSQKLVKLMEEVGTLSKAVLAYESENGHTQNIATKKDIFEDLADIILVARSIGYELGYSHNDFEEKMVEKSYKWADIQKCEARMTDNMPFEIHITIEAAEQDKFIETCKQLEVKPIILALQAKDHIIKDVMTSSVIMGNNKTAINEMERISNGLKNAGFNVIREKIETVPWHSAAPSKDSFNKMPKNCYFESHLAIEVKDQESEDKLRNYCLNTDLHLSKNAFKKREDGSYIMMATLRKYDGYREDFEIGIQNEKEKLNAIGFKIDKTIIEFSIYDTKVSHDSEWLKKDKIDKNPSMNEIIKKRPFFHKNPDVDALFMKHAEQFLLDANKVKNTPILECDIGNDKSLENYTHFFFIHMETFIQNFDAEVRKNSGKPEDEKYDFLSDNIGDQIFEFCNNLGAAFGFSKKSISLAWTVF